MTDGGSEPAVDETTASGHDGPGAATASADGAVSEDGSAGETTTTPVSEPTSDVDAVAGGADAERAGDAGSAAGVEEPSFETGPSSVGVALTVGASVIAVLPLLVAPAGLVVGVAGLVALALGVGLERRPAFGVGVVGLAGGVVLAGLLGAPSSAVLAAAAGTLLAWDVADRALVVGQQLGRHAPTARLELVRATATGLLLTVGATVAYAVFQLVGGGKPALALALLVLGATLLAASLR